MGHALSAWRPDHRSTCRCYTQRTPMVVFYTAATSRQPYSKAYFRGCEPRHVVSGGRPASADGFMTFLYGRPVPPIDFIRRRSDLLPKAEDCGRTR
jgi:hypothetical protein